MFATLYLLQRLKARFPAPKGSFGHRLFISAFMLASKIICNDTYSNKSWCIMGQGMLALREINQMEQEMCFSLEWQLMGPSTLRNFQIVFRLQRAFAPIRGWSTHSQSQCHSCAQSTGNVNSNPISSMPAFAPHAPFAQGRPRYPHPLGPKIPIVTPQYS
jgi:hypothetical protein